MQPSLVKLSGGCGANKGKCELSLSQSPAPCSVPGSGFPGNPGTGNKREGVSTPAVWEKRKRWSEGHQGRRGLESIWPLKCCTVLSNWTSTASCPLLLSLPTLRGVGPGPADVGAPPQLHLPSPLLCSVSLGFYPHPHQLGEAGRLARACRFPCTSQDQV